MDSATPFQPWTGDSKKNVKPEREPVDDAKFPRENVNPKHMQTASYIKESVATTSKVPSSTGSEDVPHSSATCKESKMDSAKIASMQKIVENTLSPESKQRVSQLLDAVEALSGTERLLLYLRLPTGVPPHDPLKQPINPLGSRAELQQTVTWIQTHLEVDPDVSLPKQDVYDEYIAHCMSSNMKPLSTADFGKVMKQVYPSVRPRRLGTRGNSRYCYAGLRKKIKLEVPQLPDLGESSKEVAVTSRETERIICDWAETKLGVKFSNISELSHHLERSPQTAPPGPLSGSPPPSLTHAQGDDPSSRHLIKQLKRKIQTQTTPGRTKKNKGQEVASESPPSTSYMGHHTPLKHEGELLPESSYGYQAGYVPMYEPRAPYPGYGVPPRAHPPPAALPSHPAHPTPTHTAMSVHEYRPDHYVFEPLYPRDLTIPTTVPADTTHNLPINLSSDASLDLSTERTEWQRRRPPDPPATRLPPLPGKKLILETYQSETQSNSSRISHTEPRTVTQHVPEEFPRSEYLPKKMRAAEILGGKLAAARHVMASTDTPSPSTTSASVEQARPEVAFLEDPKNLTSRSKSTAAALVRKELEAASPTQPGKAPTPKADQTKSLKMCGKARGCSPNRALSPEAVPTPDSCCGLDGINIKTGMICEEKHSEILNRERVISICNIDKHDLDDYLNEGNSQEHEEELLKYFQLQREAEADSANVNKSSNTGPFLEPGLDPHDDHSQGKNEKISQLRELLAKNLKNQSGSSSQKTVNFQENSLPRANSKDLNSVKVTVPDSAFKPVVATNLSEITVNGALSNLDDHTTNEHCRSDSNDNDTLPVTQQSIQMANNVEATHLYNGNIQHEPQSPTTRTQQYDFVPISDGCHSPANFNSKSPLGFNLRGRSPVKVSKPTILGRSLQTSPISHSTAASPFVSPRNTPVPRSRLCPRPIPKHNGRKRRNPLTLGVVENCAKQFAMPTDQKFMSKTSVCGTTMRYTQPMSAPPSPNILTGQYKNQIFPYSSGIPNGNNNICLNFLPNSLSRESMNGDITQPLSADPLSSEVSQFFQESTVLYRPGNETSLRSQSVPLKQGMATMSMLSFNTPVGSVPPTPVPNEFCDFGQLGDTCDISKAGLNPETLDKIYDAIDSNNAVLNNEQQNLLNANNTLTNGCDPISGQGILMEDQLNSLIPNSNDNFNQGFTNDSNATNDVEEYLKRTNSIEFDLSDLVTDRNKFFSSRSVPSTPLPFKRTATNLQIDPRRSRELFAAGSFCTVSNGISSKSVPSTPQLSDDRNVFSYSNRDFLINGNSVEVCSVPQLHDNVVDSHQGLTSPLHDILGEDTLDPLTPAADLLADLDKMDGTSYDL